MIIASKMKLFEGMEAEYEKRHDEIWDEMIEVMRDYGASNYSIFLDKETLTLFACLEVEDEEKWATLSNEPVIKKWWDYMADIMETNEDNSPVSVPLRKVFHMD